jgi:hypothetical protein
MSDREEAIGGLLGLAAAMKADPSIPAPSKTWPLTWHAPEDVDSMSALVRYAASLGVRDGSPREYEEEGGWWAEIQGYAGAIPVRVTADTGARVLDPLPELTGATA